MGENIEVIRHHFGRKSTSSDFLSHEDQRATGDANPDRNLKSISRDNFRFGPLYYAIRSTALSLLFADLGEEQLGHHNRLELTERSARYIAMALGKFQVNLKRHHAQRLAEDLVDDLIGFGPLEDLLRQHAITDIMVLGPEMVFFEEDGQIFESDIRFQDALHLLAICQRIARRIGRRVDESSPMCDARLPDGSRVNIVVPPLAIDGTALTIRKFQKQRLNFSGLLKLGALDPACVDLLRLLVEIRSNIIVIGGTGSGKTTLLNCLNHSLSAYERIVTCEDAAELQLQQRHVVRLETRPENLEGSGEIDMRALVRNSLRMRPDRIIVGEIRGQEAFDFIQAMNTGHDGSMGTMHANSALDALSRLEGLISLGAPSLAIRTIQGMITSALDVIVEVRRYPDGSRRLSEILEVIGLDEKGFTTNSILQLKYQPPGSEAALPGQYHICPIRSPRIRQKAEHRSALFRLEQLTDKPAC